MYFCVSEFEVGVNDCLFSGNEQLKVSYHKGYVSFFHENICIFQISKLYFPTFQETVYKHLYSFPVESVFCYFTLVKGLFTWAIFVAISSLLTHAIEWIDLRIIHAKALRYST